MWTAVTAFKNVIVAGNSAPVGFGESCSRLDWGYGLGNLTSLGHNLEDLNLCNLDQPGDLPNTAPLLAPLADNGGPTWTHALLTGSPAANAGDDAAAPATDQRGVPRPQAAAVEQSAIVRGLGLGTPEHPKTKIHTSFEVVFQFVELA